MASQNFYFRLYLKSGRKYRIVLIDYKENVPKKTPFGEEFFGREALIIKELWEQIKPLIGKSNMGFEIQRVGFLS